MKDSDAHHRWARGLSVTAPVHLENHIPHSAGLCGRHHGDELRDLFDGHHELQWKVWQRSETVVLVEGGGPVIFGIHKQRNSACPVRGRHGIPHGLGEKRGSHAFSLLGHCHRQPGQFNGGHPMGWQGFGDMGRQLAWLHFGEYHGVISEDSFGLPVTHQDAGDGKTLFDMLPGGAAQEVVQRSDAAIKAIAIVPL